MFHSDSKMTDGKLFFRYVIPSMISMLTAGVYTLVDGFFVGWGAGNAGLAAINVAFPLSLLIVAFGEMIGTGGAIVIALARGRGAHRVANLVFGNMLMLIIPAAAVLAAVLLPVLSPLLRSIGAAEELLPAAREYAEITLGGSIFMMATVALIAAMRNDGAPRRAMAILVVGLFANIVLDYWFVLVLHGGVAGSAWATILSQAVCCVLAAEYFIRGRSHFRFRRSYLWPEKTVLKKLALAGLPSFGVQLSVAAVILLHNRQSLIYGGVAAVASYAIISYVESTILMLQQGIGLGIQPVVSFLHGAGEELRRRRIGARALWFALGVGVVGTGLSAGGYRLIPELFHASGDVLAVAGRGLLISALVYPMLGIQKVAEAYFQAMDRPIAASLLIYLDCCALLPACLIVLPHFWGVDGIWAAMPVSKLLLLGVTFGCYLWGRPSRRSWSSSLKLQQIEVK